MLKLFDSTENMYKSQTELISFEPLSGEPGTEGATAAMKYQMGKREIEMVETITRKALPDEVTCTYETKGIWNEVINRFSEIGPDKTRWSFETEFNCSGFMRIMSFWFPGTFRKESLKFMRRFKECAESEHQGAA